MNADEGIKESAENYVRTTSFTWHDKNGQMLATANYGSGGEGWSYYAAPKRPASPPDQSTDSVRVTKYDYDAETGKLEVLTNDKVINKTVEDALGRVIERIVHVVPNGEEAEQKITTKYSYDGLGRTTSVTDPLGNVTRTEYDDGQNTVTAIDALGNRTTIVSDRGGSRLSVTDPLGRTTNIEYDRQRRPVKTITPSPAPGEDRSVEQAVYDSMGNVVQKIDPLGNVTKMEYDHFGRLFKQIDANGGVVSYKYNRQGRLESLTDPVGNTTSYAYDAQGRTVRETNALGLSREFSYSGGKLARKTDRNGRVTEYVHDRFGRPREERWLDGEKLASCLRFEYDMDVGLKSASDGNYHFDYKQDPLGRTIETTMKIDNTLQPIVHNTSYDVLGRRMNSKIGDRETGYSYTKTGAVEKIVQGNKSVEYLYNVAGERTSTKTPAVTSKIDYDGMGRLTQIDHQGIVKYNLKWDAASRIVSMNDGRYGYDKTNQLVSANYTKLPDEMYDYDLNGNRKSYTTGKNNQLLSDGVNKYEYDGEGNRISKGDTKYEWDHRNRLVKVVTPTETIKYRYDHLNRLVQRNDEYFVHDGWQVVQVLDSKGKGLRVNKRSN